MHKHTIIVVALLSMVPHITISQETPSSKETDSALPVLQSLSEGGSPVEEKGESKTAPTEITETVERPAEQSIKPEETTATQETTAPQAIPQEVPMIPYEGTLSDETMHEIAANELPTTTEAVEATEGVAPSSEKTSEEVSVIEPSQPVIPTMPEPVKEEPITIPEEETQEAPAGIDTVSLENPQGNWLYKRIWWERAEERYEKIRNLVDTVWGSRIIFFDKRNELDRNVFDPFYLNVGIGQGELQTILTELVDFFEKHREQHGDLNEQERSLYDTIATEEEALKQLKQDVESVANLDHEIDNALGTLMNQINRVRQYERQAWENFKEIAHILNDTKARELYYMIEGAARNIKNINTYIEQDFFNHFAKLVGEATKHVNRVQNQIESLKEKGVSFKRQAELLEQKQEQPAEEEEEEVAPKPKLSWFGWIMSGVNSVSSFIFSIIRMPYDMIFGK